MSTLNVATAARQYANRPADERFPSVQAMIQAADTERQLSAERDYNMKDLKIISGKDITGDPTAPETLMLEGPKGHASFSHWAFSQFCRMVGAPASYLRELPATIAAQALNFGISATEYGTRASLLIKAPNGNPTPMVRACTSDSYARIWDAELYSAIQHQICDRDPKWTLPPTWTGESAGAYRGDRDSFLILTNGGSIVTDPSLANGDMARRARNQQGPSTGTSGPADGMYRGLLVRNSEVGASSITIESILYRYICGNHMIWGAIIDKSFRRRHVGTRVVKDAIREISQFAFSYGRSSAARDQAIVQTLISSEIAHTKEAVIDELRKMGATRDQAEAAYTSCEQYESASPRSFWGTAQGLTRVSQQASYQDDRFMLDQLAGKVLARGAKQYA